MPEVNPSTEDIDAFNKAHAESFDSVRARTERWTTVTTSLTAIFAIVTPFASPTDFKDLENGPQIAIGVMLLLALFCIAFSIVALFPVQLDIKDSGNIVGFAVRLQEARVTAAQEQFKRLRWSIYSTISGMVVISAAFGVSLFGETKPEMT
jgi:hypothetical protein